jgi:hypothetical protein
MLSRIAALTGMSAAALLLLTPAAIAETPVDDGIGLGYGVTTAAVDLGAGVTDGVLTMVGGGLNR